MKQALLYIMAVVMLFSMTAAVSAAPLSDFAAGKGSIDITWHPNEVFKGSGHSEAYGDVREEKMFDGKHGNVAANVTIGLDKRWAFQYKYFAPESDTSPSGGLFKETIQEWNILYRINPQIAAFAGYSTTKIYDTLPDYQYFFNTKNSAQIGLQAVTKLNSKVKWYNVASIGKSFKQYETGLSYAFSRNLDFNVSYHCTKSKFSFFTPAAPFHEYDSGNGELNIKGIGCGVTAKF